MQKLGYVYFMSNQFDTVLYIGVTSDLARRVAEHKSGRLPGFTSKYHCNKLVYFETADSIQDAITREKQSIGLGSLIASWLAPNSPFPAAGC